METGVLKYYHGGIFVKRPNMNNALQYFGGKCHEYKSIDPDLLDLFHLLKLAKDCGDYQAIAKVYYLKPHMNLANGLTTIIGDNEVLAISEIMKRVGSVSLYVVHQESEIGSLELTGTVTSKAFSTNSQNIEVDHEINHECDVHFEDVDEVRVDSEDEDAEPENKDILLGEESDTSDDEFSKAKEKVCEFETQRTIKAKVVQEEIIRGCKSNIWNNDTNNGSPGDGGHLSEYEDSEEDIITPGESEEEDILGKRSKSLIPVVDKNCDFKKLKWVVGMKFSNREAFRDAVVRYALAQGRNLFFKKSDAKKNQRLGVQCVDGCPFRLFASWERRRDCFLLKVVNNTHVCTRDMMRNRQLKSSWLANDYLEIFKVRPHWPGKEIVDAVRQKYKIIIKKCVAYKIKYLAHKLLHGTMKEHYSKLGKYIAACTESNPESKFGIFTISVDRGPAVFQRLFVCFSALKSGFLKGCRPVVCLDGCFLKTFLGGVLLVAVGRDGNNQMFPICWGVAEGENNHSWEWFLLQFQECMEGHTGEGWTFISDQQKGVLNAVSSIFPQAEHRNCARHIYANWHKKHKGDDLKGLFWRAVRAYTTAEYEEVMQEMQAKYPEACQDFIFQNPEVFCRCFLDTRSKCDVVVNNMAETFNGYIIHSRSKHIIYMLDDIRTALMERLCTKRAEMDAYALDVCPRVQVKLEKEKEEAANCQVIPSSNTIFQVNHRLDSLVVKMNEKTCTCRKWDLSGVPCCHVVACSFFLRHKAEVYVSDYFKKDVYFRAYEGHIEPVVGERYWPTSDVEVQPPPIKIGPGRPKKKRRKDPHEDPKKPGKLTRHGFQMSCSKCGCKGHNKRKCLNTNNSIPQVVEPKKPKGRPRKIIIETEISTSIAGNGSCSTTNHHERSAEPATRAGKVRGRGRPRGSGRGGGNRGVSGRDVSVIAYTNDMCNQV